MPLVAADGTVYEAALKFGYNDPTCSGTVPITEEEWIFASHDGGQTFPQKVKIADVSPSTGSSLVPSSWDRASSCEISSFRRSPRGAVTSTPPGTTGHRGTATWCWGPRRMAA